VDYDWTGGFRQAVRLCHERGHRRIGFCAGVQATGGGHVLWRNAFLLECAELGLDDAAALCRIGSYADYPEVVAREARHLLTLPDPPTALILKCPWYHMDRFFEVLDELGLKVGTDVSVIGLAIRGSEVQAPVSCLLEPAELVGERLVDAALALVENPHEVVQVDVPFEYLEKGSVSSRVQEREEVMSRAE